MPCLESCRRGAFYLSKLTTDVYQHSLSCTISVPPISHILHYNLGFIFLNSCTELGEFFVVNLIQPTFYLRPWHKPPGPLALEFFLCAKTAPCENVNLCCPVRCCMATVNQSLGSLSAFMVDHGKCNSLGRHIPGEHGWRI